MKLSWSGYHTILKRVTGSIRSLTIILLALMVAVNALPVLAAGNQSPLAGSISGLDNLSYAVLQGWTFLDSNVAVTSGTNNWTNGYIDIAMTSNGSTADQLRVLSSGLLNITGDAVSWNGTRIGTIDPVRNGVNGQPLRINFSASLLNSGFETGNYSGWTVNQNFGTLPGDTPSGISQIATVQSDVKYSGTYAAKLAISGSVVQSCGTAHGPEITSDLFYAQAGNSLSLTWNALQTSDYYYVYGYVFNPSTGQQQELFYGRGATTNGWIATNTTINSTVCPSGTCGLKFRFLAGTQDATCGRAVGSILYIDGINVVTATATDAAVDYIVEHIEYRNTALESAGTKGYTLALVDSVGSGSGSASINISKINSTTSILSDNPDPSAYGQNYSVAVSVSPSAATGSVTISDGLGNSCAAALSGGTGSCSLPSTTIGSRTITANYPGTAAGLNPSSATTSHEVVKANTITTITSDNPDPSQYGQDITVAVTAASVTSGTPSGTVNVGDGVNTCSFSLSGGSGSCALPSTPMGAKTITATYVGDDNFNGSNHTVPHTVNKAGTTVTITSVDPEPSVYGQAADFNVAVAGNYGGTPTGTVTVREGTTVLCTVTLSGAAGSCAYDLLSAGSHTTLNAVYNGDGNFLTSASANATHQVIKANTTAVVVPSVASPVYGQPVYFTATVAPALPGTLTPAGQVQFYIDGALFDTVTLNGSGTAASKNTSSLNAQPHTYWVVYLGDSNSNGSDNIQDEKELFVEMNSTTTAVVSSAATSVFGQAFRLTVTVDEVLPSVVTPVGQVQFYFDSQPVGAPVTLTDGQADSADIYTMLEGIHPLVGEHLFSAIYLGNSNSLGSDSAAMTQTVNLAPTTLVISSSENPTVYGTSLSMTMTVSANDPSLAISAGTVQLYIDGIKYSNPLTLDASGKASRMVPYANLWPGLHAITATYTPAVPAQFEPSNNTSSPYEQMVNKANPFFTITPSVDDPVSGQPVSYTVQVSPSMPTQGTPSGTVQFFVDGTPYGDPLTLDSTGKAVTPNPVSLGAGSHTVSISYSGDDYFLSAPMTLLYTKTFEKGSTTTSLVNFEPQAAVVGQPVTVHVNVQTAAPAGGTPVGTALVSNGVDECTATLDASGAGTCQLAATSPGNHILIAIYSGDDNFKASSSAPTAGPAISKADATVSVTGFSPLSPVVGEPVIISFSVLPVAPGFGTPTGMVTFDDGLGHTCTADISVGSCEMIFEAAGPTSLMITYTGDGNFNPYVSASGMAGPVVAKATTSLAVTSSSPTSVYGQPVQFTATVSVTKPGTGMPTGYIQFKVDGANHGEPVALVTGSANSANVSNMSVGNHTFSAEYLGDANFAGISSADETQTVEKADTILVLTSSENPSPYGLPVLVTATVSANAPSLATPTNGTVQFIVDGVNYGAPMPLNPDGKATKLLPYTALWVGTHHVTAIYSGSANFNGSDNLSAPLDQVIELGNLTITLVPSVENPVYGQSFTLGSSVLPVGESDPDPTGTVQFVVDGVNLGSPVTLDSNSYANSIALADLSVGTHAVSIIYSGDDYYAPTTANIASGVSVSKANSAPTITGFVPAAPVVGEPVTVQFSVAAVAPGAGIPSGDVTISNGTDTCTVALDASGSGSCAYTPSQAGLFDLSIAYAGDKNFSNSTTVNAATGPVVSAADTSVTITGFGPTNPVFGQPVTIYFEVKADAPSTLLPSGLVTVNGSGVSCNATVGTDGKGSCLFTATSAGAVELIASYAGNSNYNPSTSLPEMGLTVAKADTTTSLTTSGNPVIEGAAVHFTASLHAVAPGSGTPAGAVQFTVDGVNAGAPVALVNGTAVSPDMTNLTLGNHVIGAVYSGNNDFTGSEATPITQNVVVGSLTADLTPGNETTLTFTTTQDEVDVTTTIQIPAGAVSENVTLVFTWMNSSPHSIPAPQDYVQLFKLEAYVDGILQSDFEFLVPVTISMTYNPTNWDESTFNPYTWNGSAWNAGGLTVTLREPDLDKVTFSLTSLANPEFALAGVHHYVYSMPMMGKIN
jgi:hypothetical protein